MNKKAPSLPATPTYQEDPQYKQGLEQLFGLGGRMTSFEGLPSELMETLSTSPETTRTFLTGLKSELDPIFRDIRQETVNQLAANRQLESSTTAHKLGQIESDLQKKYITQSTQFGLADIDRAMRNRMDLFGAGLETTRGATGMAGTTQGQRNIFNLQNYENIVAKSLEEQRQTRGGLWGGLTGAAGGGLAGFSMGGPIGAGIGALGGGLAGGFGSPGTGMGLFQGGAGMFGARPGSTAGVGEAFRGGLDSDFAKKYPYLLGSLGRN